MIKIDYSPTNYSDIFRQFVSQLHLKRDNNIGYLPAETGKGIIHFWEVSGLQVLLFDLCLNEQILFHSKKTETTNFTMRFNQAGEKNSVKASLFFGRSGSDAYLLCSTQQQFKIIMINITQEWLNLFLSHDAEAELLKKHMLINPSFYHNESADHEYRRLVIEIFDLFQRNQFAMKFALGNRLMLMMERFFTRFHMKIYDRPNTIRASAEELLRLKNAELDLVKDFAFPPPNITQLAKKAAMSPTKFKHLFKQVYEQPVYQYYQKQRLQKAKAMIITRKYSLREVAAEIGFSHIKDFLKAYQKQFNSAPDEDMN